MDESEFHKRADDSFNRLLDALEEADETGKLDVECEGGVMTINLPGSRQIIVNKHTASRQIWLSSPAAGGLHFSWNGDWRLADGRSLASVLARELKMLADVEVKF